MMKEFMLAELKQKFSKESFHIGNDNRTIAIFPAKHSQVGDVIVYDDEDEATIFIKEITHFHISPDDDSLSEENKNKIITEKVIHFLTELFTDRVLLWRAKSHRSDGCHMIGDNILTPKQYTNEECLYFLWSGQIKI